MFVGLTMTSRGNYKCLFCNHTVWKHEKFGITHVETAHPKERADLLAKKLAEAQNKPPRVEYKERIVYKTKTETQPRYSAVVYCPVCQSVDSVNIVHGQAIGAGGCFRCGNLDGQLVQHVNVNQGNYKIVGGKE